jgi:uracil-DNA glycosylase
LLDHWAASPVGRATLAAVDARVAAGAVVYPAQVFRALELTSPCAVQVVVLGQDPYHGPGQAEGLSFSVPAGVRLPPSLRNIFKEQQRDLGLPPPQQGSLVAWARQGVLLLNTSLTVEDGQPASHAKIGWQALTDAVVRTLVEDASPKVFMLWGAHAQSLLPPSRRPVQHLVLESNHPSPLSALRPPVPFIGNGHFGAANRFLAEAGRPGVDWRLG